MSDFTGVWLTTFGPMELEQKGDRVHGTYRMGEAECRLDGTAKGNRLVFKYQEPSAAGNGSFELLRYGKFVGSWRQTSPAPDDPARRNHWWVGTRGFDGVWTTSFGPMRLIHEDDRVFGIYGDLAGFGASTIEGKFLQGTLEFDYQEPSVKGSGQFGLSADLLSFQGTWQTEESSTSKTWEGRRELPRVGVRWLVVLEAYWEDHITETEYSFGGMLREFFARITSIHVRQRYFTNAEGLAQWCRDLAYLPEPTVLVIATHAHASEPVFVARNGIIPPELLPEVLQYAGDVSLVHLSSCLPLDHDPENPWYGPLLPLCSVSGYGSAVDWAVSAILEFQYLDMILARNLFPNEAAEQVKQLVGFAGDKTPTNSPYPAAKFRFFAKGK
ncbi:MAG: hypothetical protein ACFCD0_06380 [Gemmataceae bacterium]